MIIGFILNILFLLSTSSLWASVDIFNEVQQMPNIRNNSQNISGDLYSDVFNLGKNARAEHYIAGILSQRKKMLNESSFTRTEPKKTLNDKLAEKAIRLHLNSSLKGKVASSKERQKNIDTFLKIFDLNGSGAGYSGFPFLSGFKSFFSNQINFDRMVSLAENIELEAINSAKAYRDGDREYVPKTFGNIMASTFDADAADYLKMGGLLLSRDVTLYALLMQLDNFNINNSVHRKIILLPLYLRLMVEMDQSLNKLKYDRVSYFDGVTSILKKNYYFWSGSYVLTSLLEQGIKPEIATRIVGTYPLVYKKLRKLSEQVTGINLGIMSIGAVTTFVSALSGAQSSLPYWIGGGLLAGGYLSQIFLATTGSASTKVTSKSDTFQVTRLTLKGSEFAKDLLIEPCSTIIGRDEL